MAGVSRRSNRVDPTRNDVGRSMRGRYYDNGGATNPSSSYGTLTVSRNEVRSGARGGVFGTRDQRREDLRSAFGTKG